MDLTEAGLLITLPKITLEEINDESKSDSLVRCIAIIEILWITVRIVIRASRNLGVDQLEIAVVDSALCTTMIYGLNWDKPNGVQVPITVLQYWEGIPAAAAEGLQRRPREKPKDWQAAGLV